jgi:hypothetical protein
MIVSLHSSSAAQAEPMRLITVISDYGAACMQDARRVKIPSSCVSASAKEGVWEHQIAIVKTKNCKNGRFTLLV